MFGIWQKVIDWAYGHSKSFADFLGNCQVCFSHFTSWVCYAAFVSIAYEEWAFNWWQSIIFTWFTISLTWFLGLFINQNLELIMSNNKIKKAEADIIEEQINK